MIEKVPTNLSEFDELILEPFCIFEKKNFLDNKTYNDLRNNFPNEKLFEGFHENGKKIFLNNRQNRFFEFLKTNQIWSQFYNTVNNKTFINFMFKLIDNELKKIENRKKIKKYFFHQTFKNSLQERFLRKILKFINYENIRIGFEFSIIKKNCYIPPHCDTENKLLSLMIYFPPENKEENFDGIENFGTNFYKINKNSDTNFDKWESKYLDNKDTTNFHNNYSIFYKSKFEENKLIGFIKNHKSWHDVSQFDKNFDRKSLNINIFLI